MMATQRPLRTSAGGRLAAWVTLIATSAAMALAAIPAGTATAQEAARATIRVESARLDGTEAGRAVSQVFVALAPGETLAAFEVTLEFDPGVVRVVDTNPQLPGVQPQVDGRWTGATIAVDNDSGVVQAAGRAATPCEGPRPCPLFTLAWEGASVGSTGLVVTAFALLGDPGVIEDVGVVDGTLEVAALAAAPVAEPAATDKGIETRVSADDSGSRLTLLLGAGVLLAAATGLFAFASTVANGLRRLRGGDGPPPEVRDRARAMLDQAERAGRQAGGGGRP